MGAHLLVAVEHVKLDVPGKGDLVKDDLGLVLKLKFGRRSDGKVSKYEGGELKWKAHVKSQGARSQLYRLVVQSWALAVFLNFFNYKI